MNIDSAQVTGNHYAGALAGFVLFSTIDKCSVTNAAVSCVYDNDDDSGDKAGALIGYIAGTVSPASVTNCFAKSSTVNADRDAGQLIGCAHSLQTQTDNTAQDVTVTCNNSSQTDKSGQNINNTIVGRIV